MSKVYFFTDEDLIVDDQLHQNAFGSLEDVGNVERYNLESKFKVTAGAPAIAITKSILLVIQDKTNSTLVNIGLFPIDGDTSGFPVKMFIYRGISKSSLIDSNGDIPTDFSSWNSDNIIKTVQQLQNKINIANQTQDVAKAEYLGYNFSTLTDDTLIESIVFNHTDNFHPLIVNAGSQIGKFAGGTVLCGIEVILDRIGYEPQLNLLKSTNHIFEIPKLVISSGITMEEELIQRFNNRYKKEEVLTYVDITAFYGGCKNQGISIRGSNNGDNFLSKFFNRNVVYIDIRDERGFSYNHFFKNTDRIPLGFYNSAGEMIYSNYEYYEKWPLLRITDQSYATGNEFFNIGFPIDIGSPEQLNFVSSYVGKISTIRDNSKKKHLILANSDGDDSIQFIYSEPIRLRSWCYSNNKMGANYFLLKQSVVGNDKQQDKYASLWNNMFSLDMKNIFGIDDLASGEFRVNTYSSINSPLVVNGTKGEVYFPVTGIAVDKENITFFLYKDELVYSEADTERFIPTPLVAKGKFNPAYDPEDFYFDGGSTPQNVGFLNQLAAVKNQGFSLGKFSIENFEEPGTSYNFLQYSKSETNDISDTFQTFEAITLTHAEYDIIVSQQTSADFPDHPKYVTCDNYKYTEYEKFYLEEHSLAVGMPGVIENDDPSLLSISLLASIPVNYNGLPIKFTNTIVD